MKRIQTPLRLVSRGMTLVELLVAMLIGLFLIITVVSVYVSTATSSRVSVLSAQMNEDAALAIELLQEQVRLSAYSSQSPAGMRNFSGIPLRGCDGGFTAATDNGPFELLTCNNGNGPDALAVRHEATLLNSQQVTAGAVQLPANCTSNGIVAADLGSGVKISLADNRFYIANDGTNSGAPTLYCRGSNGPGGFSDAAALIPNIEDLQIRYAITRLPVVGEVMPHQVTAHVDATHAALGSTVLNWSRVLAVHICLVARSAQPVPLGNNQAADVGRYIDCTDTEKTPVDRLLRRSYRTTVYLRNTHPAVPGAFELNGAVPQNPYQHVIDAN